MSSSDVQEAGRTNVSMSSIELGGRSWCTPPGRKYFACMREPEARS